MTKTISALVTACLVTALPALAQTPEAQKPQSSENVNVTAYVGMALDTFASSELRKYLNPKDAGGVSERHMAGINFEYRVWHQKSKENKEEDLGRGIYVYGETINGVRSTDVDCKADKAIPVCQPFESEANTQPFALYALKNATSLEAFFGIRADVVGLNRNAAGKAEAVVYTKLQAGFVKVVGSGDDLVDMHHVGLGLMIVGDESRIKDSYLEIGVGKTDFFKDRRSPRIKIDGFLSMQVGKTEDVRPFIQLTVDADGRGGPDSVQVYMGIDFGLDRLFAKK